MARCVKKGRASYRSLQVYGTSIAEHRAAQLERRLAQTHVAENLFRAAARMIVSRYRAVAERARELQAQTSRLGLTLSP